MASTPYGYSTILDVVECDSTTFTRDSIEKFLSALCEAIDMEREDLHFWDYDSDPQGYAAAPSHLRGVSAVQFIKTSSIVIHTLDDLGIMFIDLFSCKPYKEAVVKAVVVDHFKGPIQFCQSFSRG